MSHEQICCCSAEGTFQLFLLAKNLLSRPPLKKMGPVFDPAKTTARTDKLNQVPLLSLVGDEVSLLLRERVVSPFRRVLV